MIGPSFSVVSLIGKSRKFYQNPPRGAYNRNVIEQREYQGEKDCLSISSAEADVIVSTGFGPRILSYALDGGENVLGWHPEAAVNTPLGTWRPYGGHRLWVAPENMPVSYAPDNDPIEVDELSEYSVRLRPKTDAAGFRKEITVTLDGSRVTLDQRITNESGETREISAWGLTIMQPGGEAIVPNEPFAPYTSENLLPVRTMALWSYTDFTDLRWRFEKDWVGLRCDPKIPHQQKFGVLNRRGWAAYATEQLLFIKRFSFVEEANYPDLNSNTEVYTAGGFAELETLSPLARLESGGSVEYRETWELTRKTDRGELFQ
jgi:hypothetical protein